MLNKITKNNLYTFLFFALLYSLPFGSYLFIAKTEYFVLFVSRIVLVISFVALLLNRDFVFFKGFFSKYFSFILVIWILYAIVSYFWVIDFNFWKKEIFSLISGAVLLFVLHSFFYKVNNAFKWFLIAWTTAFFTQMCFGIWEMYSGNHLYGNFYKYISTLPYFHFIATSIFTTFDNPNNLSIYLTISFVLFITVSNLIPKLKPFFSFFLVFICVATYIGSSRISLIALFVVYLLYVFIQSKEIILKLFNYRLSKVLILLSLVVVIFLMNFDARFLYPDNLKDKKTKELYSPTLHGEFNISTSSVSIRKNLILNGVHFFVNSKTLGVGAGNFEAYMENDLWKYDTSNTINPHNWTIQVLSQYGLLIFLPLYIWYLLLFFNISKNLFFDSFNKINNYKYSFPFLLFIAYAILSNLDSSFINNPFNWTSLVLLMICVENDEKFFKIKL